MRIGLLLALMALLGSTACSKKSSCAVPADLPRPVLEGPTREEPRRLLPIGGYTLSATWSPERCAGRMTSPMEHLRCGGGMEKDFGFTLHGLWPDGEGAQWPQYCTPVRLVPDKLIREHLCATPSPQLIQHEWEKHGSCMAKSPDEYFDRSGKLFADLRFPKMDDLRGRAMTAGSFQAAFAKANPGMTADQMRLNVTKEGWLEEVWLCLDKNFARRSCPAEQGGAAADRMIRIR
jgi:ribonuclease T2